MNNETDHDAFMRKHYPVTVAAIDDEQDKSCQCEQCWRAFTDDECLYDAYTGTYRCRVCIDNKQGKATARPLSIELEAVVEPDRSRKLLLRLSDGSLREIGRVPLTIHEHGDGDALVHKIVRTVNSHEKLVDALEKCRKTMNVLAREVSKTQSVRVDMLLCDAADAALAEAKQA